MRPLCPSPTKKHTVLPVGYHTHSSVLGRTFKTLHNLARPTQPSTLSFSITQHAFLFPLTMSKSGPFPEPLDMGIQLVYCPQPWALCKAGLFYFHDLLSSHLYACLNSSHPSKHPLATMSSLVVPCLNCLYLFFWSSTSLISSSPKQFLLRKHPCYGEHVIVVT